MQKLTKLFESLESRGYGVMDDALPRSLTERLLTECQKSWQDGAFQEANIGRGSTKSRANDIRGDSILWFEPGFVGSAAAEFMIWAAELRAFLNERYFLGLKSEEFHFARYPVGKCYQKHLDQHRGHSERQISLVLYLNPLWSESDGGQLRLFSSENANLELDVVLPKMGRLVLFQSDLVPHEVSLCFQIRWSLTGWFRNDF